MILSVNIRKAGDFDGPVETIQTAAPDFETGRQQLDELTPEGWQRLQIIVDREG